MPTNTDGQLTLRFHLVVQYRVDLLGPSGKVAASLNEPRVLSCNWNQNGQRASSFNLNVSWKPARTVKLHQADSPLTIGESQWPSTASAEEAIHLGHAAWDIGGGQQGLFSLVSKQTAKVKGDANVET